MKSVWRSLGLDPSRHGYHLAGCPLQVVGHLGAPDGAIGAQTLLDIPAASPPVAPPGWCAPCGVPRCCALATRREYTCSRFFCQVSALLTASVAFTRAGQTNWAGTLG